MPFEGWVGCGVLFSYIISCLRDFGPFRKEWENLPKAIFSAWLAAIISLVSRVIFISLILYILRESFIKNYPNVLINLNFSMFVGAIFSAVLITWSPQEISKLLIKRAKEKLHLTWWVKILVWSDRLSWGKIISMLEFIRAEQTDEIWSENDNKWAVFVIFEEKKYIVIKYHSKNKHGVGENVWLYLGLLVGNNNSKRAEAIIHVYGTRWLRREIAVLKEGRRTTAIPVKVDRRRKFKAIWLKKPPIAELEKSKRKCDHLLLEIWLTKEKVEISKPGK